MRYRDQVHSECSLEVQAYSKLIVVSGHVDSICWTAVSITPADARAFAAAVLAAAEEIDPS